MANREIQVATIGKGQAGKLLGALDQVPGYEVTNVAHWTRGTERPEVVGRGGRTVGLGETFSGEDGFEELLEKRGGELDAVIVGVTPNRTVDVMRAVLKHTPRTTGVFVEKPVGLDPDKAQEVADALGDRVVRVGHMWVANPTMPYFRQEVDRRRQEGKPAHVHLRWRGGTFYGGESWWRDPEQSGGPGTEQAIHNIHLAKHILPAELNELALVQDEHPVGFYGATTPLPEDVDLEKLANGLYVPTQIRANLVSSGIPVLFEVSGIRRQPEIVDVRVGFGDGEIIAEEVVFEKRRAYVVRGGEIVPPDSDDLPTTTDYPVPAFVRQMEWFMKALEGEETPEAVTFAAGVDSLRITRRIRDNLVRVYTPVFPEEVTAARG